MHPESMRLDVSRRRSQRCQECVHTVVLLTVSPWLAICVYSFLWHVSFLRASATLHILDLADGIC